jgi:cytochrome c553
MVRLALIVLMLTVPAGSATAQSGGGNPLIGRQTAVTLCGPCHEPGYSAPKLCGYRQYAVHHSSLLESISSLKSRANAQSDNSGRRDRRLDRLHT